MSDVELHATEASDKQVGPELDEDARTESSEGSAAQQWNATDATDSEDEFVDAVEPPSSSGPPLSGVYVDAVEATMEQVMEAVETTLSDGGRQSVIQEEMGDDLEQDMDEVAAVDADNQTSDVEQDDDKAVEVVNGDVNEVENEAVTTTADMPLDPEAEMPLDVGDPKEVATEESEAETLIPDEAEVGTNHVADAISDVIDKVVEAENRETRVLLEDNIRGIVETIIEWCVDAKESVVEELLISERCAVAGQDIDESAVNGIEDVEALKEEYSDTIGSEDAIEETERDLELPESDVEDDDTAVAIPEQIQESTQPDAAVCEVVADLVEEITAAAATEIPTSEDADPEDESTVPDDSCAVSADADTTERSVDDEKADEIVVIEDTDAAALAEVDDAADEEQDVVESDDTTLEQGKEACEVANTAEDDEQDQSTRDQGTAEEAGTDKCNLIVEEQAAPECEVAATNAIGIGVEHSGGKKSMSSATATELENLGLVDDVEVVVQEVVEECVTEIAGATDEDAEHSDIEQDASNSEAATSAVQDVEAAPDNAAIVSGALESVEEKTPVDEQESVLEPEQEPPTDTEVAARTAAAQLDAISSVEEASDNSAAPLATAMPGSAAKEAVVRSVKPSDDVMVDITASDSVRVAATASTASVASPSPPSTHSADNSDPTPESATPVQRWTYQIFGFTIENRVVLYHIHKTDRRTGIRERPILKRYNDFRELELQLLRSSSPLVVKMPRLPRPNVGTFIRGRRSKKTIEVREKAFRSMLLYIAMYPELHGSAIFERFLEKNRDTHTGWM